MRTTDEQYGRITRYLSGEMDEKEKSFFEAMMKHDEELRAEVDACRELQSAFESVAQKLNDRLEAEETWANGDAAVQNLLLQTRETWEKEAEAKGPSVEKTGEAKNDPFGKGHLVHWSWKRLLIAAMIAGGICLAALLYVRNEPAKPAVAEKQNAKAVETAAVKQPDSLRETSSPPDAGKLFAAYFMPDVPPGDAGKLLTEPMAFYRDKKFDDAAEAFGMAKAALDVRGSSAPEGHTRFYVHYYLAQAQLASGKHLAESIRELKQAIKATMNKSFISKAQWYLALAYLKKGDTVEAKKQLAQLMSYDNFYKSKAQELAAQLTAN